MTLQEFYEKMCLPIMGMNSDTADSIEEEQYKGVINTVISECLDINNARRRQRGEEEVEQQWYDVSV